MTTVIADQILEIMNLDKTSENYQKIYKIGDLILKDSSDYFVFETAIERGLVIESRCKLCNEVLVRCYSSNGVIDSEDCPKGHSQF